MDIKSEDFPGTKRRFEYTRREVVNESFNLVVSYGLSDSPELLRKHPCVAGGCLYVARCILQCRGPRHLRPAKCLGLRHLANGSPVAETGFSSVSRHYSNHSNDKVMMLIYRTIAHCFWT